MSKTKILNKLKLILDIVMITLLVILMCEHEISGITHEILGIILYFIFIIHNILNYKWYKVLFKGKPNKKILNTLIINILVFIFLILTLISSLMVSGYLFKNLFPNYKSLGRSLHMISSMWLFILLSIHLGMHLSSLLYKYKNNLYFKIIELSLILIGISVFIFIDKMYEEAFLLTQFKDFNETSTILSILKKISVILAISLITFNIKTHKGVRNEKIN